MVILALFITFNSIGFVTFVHYLRFYGIIVENRLDLSF